MDPAPNSRNTRPPRMRIIWSVIAGLAGLTFMWLPSLLLENSGTPPGEERSMPPLTLTKLCIVAAIIAFDISQYFSKPRSK